MTGSKHVTEKQLASGASVAVRPLSCRVDVAGSEIPVAKEGVFYETNPFSLLLSPVIPSDRRESRNLVPESHLPLHVEIPRFAALTRNDVPGEPEK